MYCPTRSEKNGGRRYTSAKKLVLSRAQKTRGLFYLFVAYDVQQVYVDWAFYLGKSACYVGQFMPRLRCWFPDQLLWVALEQMLLDNSNDPDARTTQHRISRHLRNRIKDRYGHIPYLY